MKRLVAVTVFIPLFWISAARAQQVTVGILVLDQPYITEMAGPLDVYHHVAADKIKVYIISDTDKEMKTYEGMPFRSHYTVANAPKLDVLVVPSGFGSLDRDTKNVPVIEWIKKAAREAKYVTSHCEGAFLLATAGLLNGKNATTFPADRAQLRRRFPTAKILDQRVVVDGNLVTSAGGLASYEGSLWVIAQLFGQQEANRIGEALVFGQSNLTAALSSR